MVTGQRREPSTEAARLGRGMADARLLRRARHGDPRALERLWLSVVDDAWSVARAVVGEDPATNALVGARGALVSGSRELTLDHRWVELPFRRLFEILHGHLALPPLSAIDTAAWGIPGPVAVNRELLMDPEAARRAVRFAPPALRLVYLFSLLTPCTLDGIARFAGVPLSRVRQAHTAVAWRVVRELQA